MYYKPQTRHSSAEPLTGQEHPEDTAHAVAAIRALFAEEGQRRTGPISPAPISPAIAPEPEAVPAPVAAPAAQVTLAPVQTQIVPEPEDIWPYEVLDDEHAAGPEAQDDLSQPAAPSRFSPDWRLSAGIFALALVLFHPLALPLALAFAVLALVMVYARLGSERINAALLRRYADLQDTDPARAAKMRRTGNRWAARLDRWTARLPAHWTQNLYFPVFDSARPDDIAANDPFARLMPQERL